MQDLAKQVLNQLTRQTRMESGVEFYSIANDAPQWMQDLVRNAHDGSLPDGSIYGFIVDALHAIIENEDQDEARNSLESDIYNRELLNWLSSSLSRAELVNEAVQEFGIDAQNFDLFQVIGMGQLNEKRQVFELVLNGLQNRSDEVEAAQ